jgi:ABC-type sugar transport system ATPase subunit
MARVQLSNLNKDFGRNRVVRDVNLTIEDGEFMVLVGPSGCGKSTILRMMAGLEEVTGGTIDIDGRVVNDMEPARRNLAMVFQNYALYPHMTVYKNLAFPLKMRGEKRDVIDRRVRETAEILGIDSLLDRKPKTLSGGQMQRVALGRAIVREPLVFLFDEPLSNLDAKMRVEMRAEIRRLHRTLKTTMIYVTHDQEEAMTMGSRIAVLEGGVLQQADAPMSVYHRPVNRFVASFIGSPAMNFFEGLVEGGVFAGDGVKTPADGIPDGATVLGIRPHDIAEGGGIDPGSISPLFCKKSGDIDPGSIPPPSVVATVDVVEPLGSETHLHCLAGKTPFLVSLAGHHPLARGDEVKLCFSRGGLHFFRAETGERLA